MICYVIFTSTCSLNISFKSNITWSQVSIEFEISWIGCRSVYWIYRVSVGGWGIRSIDWRSGMELWWWRWWWWWLGCWCRCGLWYFCCYSWTITSEWTFCVSAFIRWNTIMSPQCTFVVIYLLYNKFCWENIAIIIRFVNVHVKLRIMFSEIWMF